MGFNRDNYIKIKEEYDGKYLLAREKATMRRTQIHFELPEVQSIDKQLSEIGIKTMYATLKGDISQIEKLKENSESLQTKRADILEQAGYPRDYTEVKYECPLCSDTGAIDNRMCSCMRKKLIDAGIESSGMADMIKKQNFSNFSLDYYKQSAANLKVMSSIYKLLKKYADEFNSETSGNVAMFGGTGLGKTHLSSAVAGTVIEKGYDVYYVSSVRMMSDFEQKRFESRNDINTDIYFDCDLLIIDDLGVEIVNQFTASCLYDIINSRLNSHKSTILNTNLSCDEFRNRYWDRITSRVFGEYIVLPFCGEDIRKQKAKGQ